MRRLVGMSALAVALGSLAPAPMVALVVPDHPSGGSDIALVSREARWRYSDRVGGPGSGWKAPTTVTGEWKAGRAPFGYGSRWVSGTRVAPGRSAYYFRSSFRIDQPLSVTRLRVRAQISDRAVLYLNGSAIWRLNTSTRPADRNKADRAIQRARAWRSTDLPTDGLRVGRNVLAVEVHDHGRRNVRFDLALDARIEVPVAAPTASPAPSASAAPASPAGTSSEPAAGPVTPETTPAVPAPPGDSPAPVGTNPAVPGAPVDAEPRVMCEISDPRLPEISGLAGSVHHDGILWTHNDSGDTARIFAIDAATCAVRAEVALNGVTARDIEAIAMGRSPTGGPELWVADVGNNNLSRGHVQLYRLPEPTELTDQTVGVERIQVSWTEGARNCETILVDPVANGDVFLVSKETVGRVYRLGGDFRTTGTASTGVPLGTVGTTATDGAVAPDRSMTVIRYYTDAWVMAGVPGTDPQLLRMPVQPQGEAVTFSADSRYVYIASEGVADLIRIPVTRP